MLGSATLRPSDSEPARASRDLPFTASFTAFFTAFALPAHCLCTARSLPAHCHHGRPQHNCRRPVSLLPAAACWSLASVSGQPWRAAFRWLPLVAVGCRWVWLPLVAVGCRFLPLVAVDSR